MSVLRPCISHLHSSGTKGLETDSPDKPSLGRSQPGPSNHTGMSARSDPLMPLEGMSAGFSFPGQCFQCGGLTIKAPDGDDSIFHKLLPLMVDPLNPKERHLGVTETHRVTQQQLRFQCSVDTGNQLG